MKKMSFKDIAARICIGICFFFMLTIGIKVLTKAILVDRLHMNNKWLEAIFSKSTLDARSNSVAVDWAVLYPFENTVSKPENKSRQLTRLFRRLQELINRYSSSELIGFHSFAELERKYKQKIGWDLVPYTEYNGVTELSDGYLVGLTGKEDLTPRYSALAEFAAYCRAQGTDFLYVQAPGKIGKYTETDPVIAATDFSNQNIDDFLTGLAKMSADILDLREEIKNLDTEYHSLFFKTDHHWKPETGLWAARVIAEKLNAAYGFDMELSLFDADKYESVVYKDWFLGSQGKKVTLARALPEDISLLYPRFDTNFGYKIPGRGLDVTGDFSVTYNMAQIMDKNYYGLDPYLAYNYGDNPLVQFRNNKKTGRKIAIIKDSFANCVAPFLALGVEYLDVFDLRVFNGSIRNYIAKEKPDIVIVLYVSISGNGVDMARKFDFR